MTSPWTMQMTPGNRWRHPDTPEGNPWVPKPILVHLLGQGRRRMVGIRNEVFPFVARTHVTHVWSDKCDT